MLVYIYILLASLRKDEALMSVLSYLIVAPHLTDLFLTEHLHSVLGPVSLIYLRKNILTDNLGFIHRHRKRCLWLYYKSGAEFVKRKFNFKLTTTTF